MRFHGQEEKTGLDQLRSVFQWFLYFVTGCQKILLKTIQGFSIKKGELLSCGMMPSMNSNEQVSEPVTTSAPQSQVEQQQSDIPVTSFCDINDLNSHFKNSNLRFNCGKKSCLGLVYSESSRIGSIYHWWNFQVWWKSDFR